jgi:hypothetical protein
MPPPFRIARWLCCVLALAAVPRALAGQDASDEVAAPPRPRKAVGAEVGYSRSDLTGNDARQLRSRQGALTGVFLQLPLGGPLSLRPEVLFALKGGRAQAPLDSTTVPLEIELAYIEVPVLLRATIPGGRVRPTIFGGPAPSLQIGCDLQVVDPVQPVRATCGEADFTLFRDFDIGLVAGAGLEVRWPQSALALEARYNIGLRSLLSDFDVKNRAFGLVLALTF